MKKSSDIYFPTSRQIASLCFRDPEGFALSHTATHPSIEQSVVYSYEKVLLLWNIIARASTSSHIRQSNQPCKQQAEKWYTTTYNTIAIRVHGTDEKGVLRQLFKSQKHYKSDSDKSIRWKRTMKLRNYMITNRPPQAEMASDVVDELTFCGYIKLQRRATSTYRVFNI